MRIIFRSLREGVSRLWQISSNGGNAEPITEARGAYAAWSPDGNELYFLRAGNFWTLLVEDGTERPVTSLVGRRGTFYDLATDGQYLYFNFRNDIGDIWVMDVVRE